MESKRENLSEVQLEAIPIMHLSRDIFTKLEINKDNPDSIKPMIDFHARLNAFIVKQILAQDEPKKRIDVMEKWSKIMKECYDHGDFASAFAISSAFDIQPIYRLDTTKSFLSLEAKQNLQLLEEAAKRFVKGNNLEPLETEGCLIPPAPFLSSLVNLTIEQIKYGTRQRQEGKQEEGKQQEGKAEIGSDRRLLEIGSDQGLLITANEKFDGLKKIIAAKQQVAKTENIPHILFQRTIQDEILRTEPVKIKSLKVLMEKSKDLETDENMFQVQIILFANKCTNPGLSKSLLEFAEKRKNFKVDPEDPKITSDFVHNVNQALSNRNLTEVKELLESADLKLTQDQLHRIEKQDKYRDMLPDDIRNEIGNQYISGKSTVSSLGRTDTEVKIDKLNKYLETPQEKKLDEVKKDLRKMLDQLNLKISDKALDRIVLKRHEFNLKKAANPPPPPLERSPAFREPKREIVPTTERKIEIKEEKVAKQNSGRRLTG